MCSCREGDEVLDRRSARNDVTLNFSECYFAANFIRSESRWWGWLRVTPNIHRYNGTRALAIAQQLANMTVVVLNELSAQEALAAYKGELAAEGVCVRVEGNQYVANEFGRSIPEHDDGRSRCHHKATAGPRGSPNCCKLQSYIHASNLSL